MNTSVDGYLRNGCMRCKFGATPQCKVHDWIEEINALRKIALGVGLEEKVKWGVPCYTSHGGNIAMVAAFRDSCSISFFKGALLKDDKAILLKPGEYSQAGRVIRFKKVDQILALKSVLKRYLLEAIDIERTGLKFVPDKEPQSLPLELEEKLHRDPVFRSAFSALTPGRQRGYIIYFSKAKQSMTRRSRIEKCSEDILNGIGLHDKYSGSRSKL